MTEFFTSTTTPPVAVLTVTPQTGTEPVQVTADSSGSTDPNGGITSRLIDFGDGTTATTTIATNPGTYAVKLTVTDNLGLTASTSKTVTVSAPQQSVAVTISPTTATVSSGGTKQFADNVTGNTNTAVKWTASGGTVSTTGFFTAPSVTSTTTITVTVTSIADPTKLASATVTVQPPAQAVAISISPTTATVSSGGTIQFTDTVSGSSDTAVNWTASGGTISTGGLFTAPSVTSTTTLTVTITSVADPTKSTSATITVQVKHGGGHGHKH